MGGKGMANGRPPTRRSASRPASSAQISASTTIMVWPAHRPFCPHQPLDSFLSRFCRAPQSLCAPVKPASDQPHPLRHQLSPPKLAQCSRRWELPPTCKGSSTLA